eukprot:GHVP01029878.1.p1 GENE.GHVP01029878.1~~GHVP01029878.1.p1  ORF type:complete len:324 (+),score=66.09 GHVP01029878.1:1313-2284(+)
MSSLQTNTQDKDISYYEILGLEKTCKQQDIKKAYHKQALLHHPDKNKDDPNADETFKSISEAYEILSDPDKRAFYDKHGKKDQNIVFQDPIELLKKELGIDIIETIVGEAAFIHMFIMMAQNANPDTINMDEYQENQKIRTKFVYNTLLKKISIYTEGNYTDEEFKAYIQKEMSIISWDDSNLKVLRMIGEIYYTQAKISLEKRFFGIAKYIYYGTQSNFRSVGYAKDAYMSLYRLNKFSKKAQENELQTQEVYEKSIEAMQNIFFLETDSVLKAAIGRILEEDQLGSRLRKKRATAIKIIGKVYRSYYPNDKKEEETTTCCT